MTEFVAGFAIDDTGRVALVRKNRPAWQDGHLNAIGGKIEAGEDGHSAMVREFDEEAGLLISEWEHFATITFPTGLVEFYRAFISSDQLDQVRTMTDEPIELHSAMPVHPDALPNLAWLIPLALYTHDVYEPLVAREIHGPNNPV